MAVLQYFVAAFAAHDIHQVARAKADAAVLLDTVNRGKQHLRRLRAVPDFGRLQAVVAVAAGRAGLVKIGQQAGAPAIGGFGQTQERLQLAAHDLFEIFLGRAFVNHAPLVHHVLQAVAHPGVGGQAVAPGAAGLLVVALDVFGHVQMRHKAHVRLVDAHAKGDGGHHHDAILAQKPVLVQLPGFAFQARVVGQGVDARLRQGVGDVLHFFTRLAVHDAGVARVLALDKAQQLRGALALFDDGVADVGPVKAADKGAGVFQLQTLEHVGARERIGRGGEGHARHARVALVQHGQRAVFGPEVVAPLAYAMRLVNRKQAELPAFKQRVELGQKARRGYPLGAAYKSVISPRSKRCSTW